MQVSVLGCGWLGLPLARELVGRGYTVRGSVTRADKLAALEEAGVRGHRLELTPDLTGNTEGFFDADTLIITLPPKRREPGVEARYPAQIAAVLAATTPETHIVFTGSTSVYPDLNRTVTEEDAGGVITPSGEAVLAAETLLRERGATILRLAGLYGYDRQPGRSLAGRDVPGGEARVNLVHRDDVLRVLLTVVESSIRNTTLNVCADRHPTRRGVYTHQAERFGFAPPHFVEPHGRAYKLVSNEKLKGQLGFTFSYPDPLLDAP